MTRLSPAAGDNLVRLADMPRLLKALVHEAAGETIAAPGNIRYEVEIARGGYSNMNEMDRIGRRSVLACPDCQGVMWEIDEDDLFRYRCHVGHTYTAEMMSLALDENLRREAMAKVDQLAAAGEMQRAGERAAGE